MNIPVLSPSLARADAGMKTAWSLIHHDDTDGRHWPTPIEQATLHLRVLHEPGQYIELRWPGERGGMVQQFFVMPDTAAMAAVRHSAKADIYVGVIPRWRRKGGADSLSPSRWVWVECDHERAIDRCLNMKRPPDLIVTTSRHRAGHHAHCYWSLTRHYDAPDISRACKRLAWEVGADMRATDPARILRVAGTLNHKAGLERVEITYADFEQSAVRLADLVAGLPDPTPPRSLPTKKPRRPSSPEQKLLADIDARRYVPLLSGREVRQNMAQCPFHGGGQERTPSLHVGGPNEGLWHCFGCDEGGDIFTFAGKLWGLDTKADFPLILKRLEERT